jgi:hypothetical protein
MRPPVVGNVNPHFNAINNRNALTVHALVGANHGVGRAQTGDGFSNATIK